MPRLKCTYSEFIAIIAKYGFELHRHGATSHARYRGIVNGEVRFVDCCGHSSSDEIPIGTLQSMIRQTGLSKRLFRK
ncbi:MAG: type II toxin-antitoxin system HicA family toxin [Rhodoplanes sp.]